MYIVGETKVGRQYTFSGFQWGRIEGWGFLKAWRSCVLSCMMENARQQDYVPSPRTIAA